MNVLFFARGDIVTDCDPSSIFKGTQGKVVRVYPNGTVRVQFPEDAVPEYTLPSEFFDEDGELKTPVIVTYFAGEGECEYLRKDEAWRFVIPPGRELDAIQQLLRTSFWLKTLDTRTNYDTQHDDTDGDLSRGWLNICFSEDSDAWLNIDHAEPLRFRTIFGGGMHLKVRSALLILAEAIRLEKEEGGR